MKIKKMVVFVLAAFVAGVVFAAKLSLAEARAQISECIAKPAKMAQVMKDLSPADQLAFLDEVNEAISKMPGSNEAKAASYLNINRAAVTAVEPANKKAMIAEVFATVPPEVLTVINERFAADLLNINANPALKTTNEQFTEMALSLMEKVNERCTSAENGAVRSTFAVLMLIRASNNSIPELTEKLIKTLPETAQTAARTEWVPAAMGEKQTKTYEPLLGSADNAGTMVSNDVVIRLAGPQLLESMLGDVIEGTPLINTSIRPEIYGVGIREEDIKPQPWVDEPKGYQGQLLIGF